MGQEFTRILLLQFDQVRVEKRERLGVTDQIVVRNAIPRLIGVPNVQVQVDVDPPLLEGGEEKIHAIKLIGVETAGVISAGR